MAFKGSVSAVADTASTTCPSLTPSGFSIAAGDYLIIACMQKVGGNVTFTAPSSSGSNSWVKGDTLTSSIPYRQVPTSGFPTQVFVKIADSTDVGTPSYAPTSSYSEPWVAQLIVATGRLSTSAIDSAFPSNAVSAVGASANTPYSYSFTGITASSGYDFLAVAFASVIGGSLSSPAMTASGFSNGLAGGNTTSGPALMASMYQANVSSVSTFSASITNGTALTLSAGGFLMAMPPAASSGGSKSQGFFGASVIPLAGVSWAIRRRMERATKRNQ